MTKTWSLANFLLLLSCVPSSGQINSNAYRALLNTLYKKTVPLVSCEESQNVRSTQFLDSRARAEFNVSHIADARWVGYDDFSMDRVKDLDKDQPIIIYCSVGVRSERIGKRLLDAGFTDVRNLYGSLFEWVNQGYPIVDANGRPTQKVHAYSPTWGMWLNKGEKVFNEE